MSIAAILLGASMCAAGVAEPEVGPPAPEPRAPVWVALDRDLKPVPCVAIARIDADEVVLERDGQAPLTLKRADVAAIVPAAWAQPALSPAWSALPEGTRPEALANGLLVLTDGTRIVGAPAIDRTQGETLGWAHGSMPAISAKLDTVRSVFFRAPDHDAADLPTDGSADRVALMNGDVLTGLVTGFSAKGDGVNVGIEARTTPGKPAESRSVNLDRVSRITLANPAVASPAVRVWLEDGSVIGGLGLTASAGGGVVLAGPGGATPAWPMVQVRAMSLKGAELAGLAGLAMTLDNTRSGNVMVERRESYPAPLDAESIRLRAPAGVTLALPPGARRVAGSILLPEECREWGDAVITITAGGKTLVTQRMSARSPYLAFNSAVSGSTLRISLEPGEGGPIQDEVVIQHAVVISGGEAGGGAGR